MSGQVERQARRRPPSRPSQSPRPVRSAVDLERFLQRVGIALRYHATAGLPVASVYAVVCGSRRDADGLRPAIELTHRLIATRTAVETNVVADRVCVSHRSLAPALRRLARRGSAEEPRHLGDVARGAWELLLTRPHSVGELRRALRLPSRSKEDPLHAALADLQREFWVDRGPASVPSRGIPYLSPEGYPWRPFHLAHPDLERQAVEMDAEEAARQVIARFLRGAGLVPKRKLASIFRRLMSRHELEQALASLLEERTLEAVVIPRDTALAWRNA